MQKQAGLFGWRGLRRPVSALGASLLAACAADGVPPERVDLGAGQAELVGWLARNGEFRLYGTRRNMLKQNLKHCVSGAFPLERNQKLLREYEGRQVRVRGRIFDWNRTSPDVIAVIHGGSHIINGCRQDYVLFAREVAPVE